MTQFSVLDRARQSAWQMTAALLVAIGGLAGTSCGTPVDFQDLSLPAANSYWNGSDNSGGFTSRGAYFNNSYDQDYGSWDGWSYSNVVNTTTPGYAKAL